MPKHGRSRKKNRTHVATPGDGSAAPSGTEKVPKSLIVRRGKTCNEMNELVVDLRRMMLPYTAMNYQDSKTSKKISLQQYSSSIALPMGITHLIQVSQSSNNDNNTDYCNLRIARVPDGPVLYFRIHSFTLIRHIQSIQRKPVALNTTSITNYSPIVVTNNFGDHTAPAHIKLLRITFQNLFPQINVSTIKLKDCRRVVLFNLIEHIDENSANDDENNKNNANNTIQIIEMRHYAVKATPLGMNRKVRRILEVAKKPNKLPPNLHNVHDIADYITNQSTSIMNGSTTSSVTNDVMSDSEPEDDAEHHVTLPDTYVGVGNVAKQKSALKLIEIGPRLSLQLLKVEKGLEDKNKVVLYNVHVTKTKAEIEQKQNEIRTIQQLKDERKRIQERNVDQKRILKEQKLQQKQIKIQQRLSLQQQQQQEDGAITNNIDTGFSHNNDAIDDEDDDDDNAYKIEGVSSSEEEDDGNDDDDEDQIDG